LVMGKKNVHFCEIVSFLTSEFLRLEFSIFAGRIPNRNRFFCIKTWFSWLLMKINKWVPFTFFHVSFHQKTIKSHFDSKKLFEIGILSAITLNFSVLC